MTKEEQHTYWREVVEEQATSGLEASVFCRKRNIKIPQFYRWRKKFHDISDESSESRFIQLMPGDNNPESGIRIRVLENVLIEIDIGFDPVTLRTAVEALSLRG